MRIDLHVHSNCSDGSASPEELILLAQKEQIAAFALTDHDTVEGVERAQTAANKVGIILIPGIELSAEYEGQDIHILGYQIKYKDPAFLERIEGYRNERDIRNIKMIQKMQDVGFDITQEKLEKRYPNAVLTRAHFAEYLFEAGYVKSVKDAFDRYLGAGKICYLPKKRITCREAITCIKKANGYAVLAHPYQYQLHTEKLEQVIEELKNDGLDGIEAIYTTHSQQQEHALLRLAKKYNLQITGGSDFHGSKKPNIFMGRGFGSLYIHHDCMNWLFPS